MVQSNYICMHCYLFTTLLLALYISLGFCEIKYWTCTSGHIDTSSCWVLADSSPTEAPTAEDSLIFPNRVLSSASISVHSSHGFSVLWLGSGNTLQLLSSTITTDRFIFAGGDVFGSPDSEDQIVSILEEGIVSQPTTLSRSTLNVRGTLTIAACSLTLSNAHIVVQDGGQLKMISTQLSGWGRNDQSQLLPFNVFNPSESQLEEHQLTRIPLLFGDNIVDIGVSGMGSFFLSCLGFLYEASGSTLLPQLILKDINQIIVNDHILARVADSNTIWSRGRNDYNQIIDDPSDFIDWVLITIPEVEEIVDIAVGKDCSLILGNNGLVYSWGRRRDDQGFVTATCQPFDSPILGTPTLIELPFAVSSISAGYHFSLFISTNDELYGCGNNEQSQISPLSAKFFEVPEIISHPNDIIIQASATSNMAFFLNDHGYLSRTGRPPDVYFMERVSSFSTGVDHVLLNHDGDVVSGMWNNDFKQIDPSSSSDLITNPIVIGDGVIGIASGDNSFFLKKQSPKLLIESNSEGTLVVEHEGSFTIDSEFEVILDLPVTIHGEFVVNKGETWMLNLFIASGLIKATDRLIVTLPSVFYPSTEIKSTNVLEFTFETEFCHHLEGSISLSGDTAELVLSRGCFNFETLYLLTTPLIKAQFGSQIDFRGFNGVNSLLYHLVIDEQSFVILDGFNYIENLTLIDGSLELYRELTIGELDFFSGTIKAAKLVDLTVTLVQFFQGDSHIENLDLYAENLNILNGDVWLSGQFSLVVNTLSITCGETCQIFADDVTDQEQLTINDKLNISMSNSLAIASFNIHVTFNSSYFLVSEVSNVVFTDESYLVYTSSELLSETFLIFGRLSFSGTLISTLSSLAIQGQQTGRVHLSNSAQIYILLFRLSQVASIICEGCHFQHSSIGFILNGRSCLEITQFNGGVIESISAILGSRVYLPSVSVGRLSLSNSELKLTGDVMISQTAGFSGVLIEGGNLTLNGDVSVTGNVDMRNIRVELNKKTMWSWGSIRLDQNSKVFVNSPLFFSSIQGSKLSSEVVSPNQVEINNLFQIKNNRFNAFVFNVGVYFGASCLIEAIDESRVMFSENSIINADDHFSVDQNFIISIHSVLNFNCFWYLGSYLNWSSGVLIFGPNSVLNIEIVNLTNSEIVCDQCMFNYQILNDSFYLKEVHLKDSSLKLSNVSYNLSLTEFRSASSIILIDDSYPVFLNLLAFDTNFTLSNLELPLFIGDLVCFECFTFGSSYFTLIIGNSSNSSLYSETGVIKLDLFADLAKIYVLNEPSFCLNTFESSVMFPIDNALDLAPFIEFSALYAEMTTYYYSDYAEILFYGSQASNTATKSLEFSLSVPVIQYQNTISFDICPIIVEHFAPATNGLNSLITGRNFGSGTVKISYYSHEFLVTSLNHNHLSFDFVSGSGCHYIYLTRLSDNVNSVEYYFCYQKPKILEIVPSVLPMVGEVSVIGSNFDPLSTVISFENAKVVANITKISFTSLQIFVLSVCDVVYSEIELIIHVFPFEACTKFSITFPKFEVIPSVFSSEPSFVVLKSKNLATLFQCNSGFSVFSPNIGEIPAYYSHEMIPDDNSHVALNLPLLGLVNVIRLFFKLEPNLGLDVEFPVTSLYPLPLKYACFVDQPCAITVVSTNNILKLDQLELFYGENLMVTYHSKNSSLFEIIFVTSETGVPNIQLCSTAFCYKIHSLPFVIRFDSINPHYVNFMNISMKLPVDLFSSGLDFYSLEQVKNSLVVNISDYEIIEVSSSLLTIIIIIKKPCTATFYFRLFNESITPSKFSVIIDYFVEIPPFIPINSEVYLYLSVPLENLFLILDGIHQLRFGFNVFNVSLPVDHEVFLFHYSFTLPVSKTLDKPVLPQLLQSFSFYTLINKWSFEFTSFEVVNIDGIHISYSEDTSLIELNATTAEPGTFHLTVINNFFNSFFKIEFFGDVAYPPFSNTVSSVFNYNLTINSYFMFNFSHCTIAFEIFADNTEHFTQLISSKQRVDSCEYFILVDLTIPLFYGTSSNNVYLLIPDFDCIHLGNITIFNFEFYSDNYLSIHELRTITIYSTSTVDLLHGGLQWNCYLQEQRLAIEVDVDSIQIFNVAAPSLQHYYQISVRIGNFEVSSVNLPVEPFFEEQCYVSVHKYPRILNFSLIDTESFDQIFDPVVINNLRCCQYDLDLCSINIRNSTEILVEFMTTFDVYYVVITTNSTCSDSNRISPFVIKPRTNTVENDWHCYSIPNGFTFALTCSLNFELKEISEFYLYTLENVSILEFEIYGHDTSKCLSPIDFSVGITSNGTILGVSNVSAQYFDSFHSNFDSLLLFYSALFSNNSNFLPIIIIHVELTSPFCYSSHIASFQHKVDELNDIVLVRSKIWVNPGQDHFQLNLFCFDSFKLKLNCSILDLIVTNSSLFIYNYHFSEDSLLVYPNSFPLNHHFIDVSLNSHRFILNFTLLVTFDSYLSSKLISKFICPIANHGFLSCTVIELKLFYNEIQNLETITQSLSLEDVEFSTSSFVNIIVSANEIQLIGPPEAYVTLSFAYNNLASSFSTTLEPCPSSTIMVDGQCSCPPGEEISQFGHCTKCVIDTFNEFPLGICISCPSPRVTLHSGSYHADQCVCPSQMLDIQGDCVSCPRFAQCHHGDLSFVARGFIFDGYALGRSPFKMLVRNSSCIEGHLGHHCMECEEGYRTSLLFCLKTNSFINTFYSLFCILLLFVLVFVFDVYVFPLCFKDYKLLPIHHTSLLRECLYKISHHYSQWRWCPFAFIVGLFSIIFYTFGTPFLWFFSVVCYSMGSFLFYPFVFVCVRYFLKLRKRFDCALPLKNSSLFSVLAILVSCWLVIYQYRVAIDGDFSVSIYMVIFCYITLITICIVQITAHQLPSLVGILVLILVEVIRPFFYFSFHAVVFIVLLPLNFNFNRTFIGAAACVCVFRVFLYTYYSIIFGI
ncbi:hypothetical protein P9112_012551 [Eukaryota sp. TZLM1-RC]